MNKPIAIIAGEPNSISSEIIFKSWKLRKQYIHKPMFVIGNIRLLNLQKIKMKFQIKIKKINIPSGKRIGSEIFPTGVLIILDLNVLKKR